MTKILCARSGFAGDIVMTTVALQGIKQKFPDSELTYVMWRQYIEILALCPWVNSITVPGKVMPSEHQILIDFRHESEMPRFEGDADSGTYWGKVHALQAKDKGVLDEMESYKPSLFIGPDDRAEKRSGKLCVINCWSQNGIGWRLWDIDNWAKLVPELKKMGYKVVHLGVGSDPEIPYVDTDLRGKTRLAQVAGVLAVADLCIAIDSFICHVSHSLKFVRNLENDTIEKVGGSTPTVLLAGPIAPSCVVPEDARCVPVSNYPDCDGPCGVSHPGTEAGKICEYGNSCMKALTVERVLGGVECLT